MIDFLLFEAGLFAIKISKVGDNIIKRIINGSISFIDIKLFFNNLGKHRFRAIILNKKKHAIDVGIFSKDTNYISERYEFFSKEGLSSNIPNKYSIFYID